MNKLFIIFLAICLVTVNSAIVKREAEGANPNYLEEIQKKLQELSKNVNDNISQALNPEQIKKTFNEGVDSLSKMFNDLNKQEGPKQ